MSLEIKGKVIKVLKKESGTSTGGKEWVRRSFMIETPGEYPKKIMFAGMKDTILERIEKLKIGSMVNVFFSLETREHNEKYYTNATAFKIVEEKAEAQPAQTGSSDSDIEELPF